MEANSIRQTGYHTTLEPMKELIKFYLMQRPRSVSDMIEGLTEKELSSLPAKRSEQIPRMAGNWFRRDSGYLWQLQDSGEIKDIGRQYAIDREVLVQDFLGYLNVYDCFPQHEVKEGNTPVTDAYSGIIGDYTLQMLTDRLLGEVFHGDIMAELFDFDTWKDILLVPETDENRVASYRLFPGFWPSINYILLSSLLKSRKLFLRQKMEDKERYFDHKNRLTGLEETETELIERAIYRIDPAAEQDVDGTFTDPRLQRLASSFGEAGLVLDKEVTTLLSHIYLLSFRDGVALFRQYSKHTKDTPLLFNLLEKGWILEPRSLEKLSETGNYLVPLNNLHAYLDILGNYLVS